MRRRTKAGEENSNTDDDRVVNRNWINGPRLFKAFLSLVITVLFLSWLFLNFNKNDLRLVFNRISAFDFFSGLILYLLSFVGRTLRFQLCFRLLFGTGINSIRMYGITTLHSMISNLIPLRIGEFSFIYFMRREGMPLASGSFVLLLVRFFDGLAIISIFTLLSFFLKIPGIIQIRNSALLALFVLVVVFLVVLIYWERVFHLISKKPEIIPRKIFLLLESAGQMMRAIRNAKALLSLYTVSIFLWSILLIACSMIILPHLVLPYPEMITGLIFPSVMAIVPIQGVAGAGTIEAGFILGFLVVGANRKLLNSLSLTYHAVTLVYQITGGISGLIIYFSGKRSRTFVSPGSEDS